MREEPGGPVVVAFHGDDGRRGIFDVSALPLPGWHEALAAAFAGRTGPAGGLRTFAAAGTGWGALGRLVRFLASLPDPPATPGELTPAHLDAFGARRAASTPGTALRDLAEARQLLTSPALRDLVRPEVVDHVQRRLPAPRGGAPAGRDSAPAGAGAGRPPTPTTGFSDGELARLLAALRSDAAAVRDRIRAGEDLLRRYQADPQALPAEEQELGRLLGHAAATGEVGATPGAGANPLSPERHRVAGRLFLTLHDLPPLMMLAAALTERNGETIKRYRAAWRGHVGRRKMVVGRTADAGLLWCRQARLQAWRGCLQAQGLLPRARPLDSLIMRCPRAAS